MSGRIPRAFIDDLLVRADIVGLIDELVPLKKSGSNFVARCPFHSEKTPSFSVSRTKQLYYCFGCGAGGNAISFLMDYNHLDFVEAVEDLAAFVGVEVPREAAENRQDQGKKADLSRLYDVLQQVSLCYAGQLRSHPDGKKAIAYFKSRGVSSRIARDFQLGYAPAEWRFLVDSFDRKRLLEAGLLASKEGGNEYDRFRDRVMFPIRDRRGRVVGFGGRVIDDSLPKYINSPETAVFQKGREVYGLYELLEKNSKPDLILVTEGYMDVIALVQSGVEYAVATLGTATTRSHIDLLFRFTRELVFCFDGDDAGRKAAWRALDAAIPSLRDGRRLRFMQLPQGADPDSLVREEGMAAFVERISSGYAMSDYFFEQLTGESGLQSMEARAGLVEKAKPYLERLPVGVFREMMYARLKELAKTDMLDLSNNPATLNAARTIPANKERRKVSPLRMVIALLLQHPELVEIVEKKNIDWPCLDMPGVPLFREIVRRIRNNPQVTLAGLMEGFRDMPEENQIRVLAQWKVLVPEDGVESEFSGSLDRLVEQVQEHGLEKLIAKEKKEGLNERERELLLSLLSKKQ